jgi:hypothetical protein
MLTEPAGMAIGFMLQNSKSLPDKMAPGEKAFWQVRLKGLAQAGKRAYLCIV